MRDPYQNLLIHWQYSSEDVSEVIYVHTYSLPHISLFPTQSQTLLEMKISCPVALFTLFEFLPMPLHSSPSTRRLSGLRFLLLPLLFFLFQQLQLGFHRISLWSGFPWHQRSSRGNKREHVYFFLSPLKTWVCWCWVNYCKHRELGTTCLIVKVGWPMLLQWAAVRQEDRCAWPWVEGLLIVGLDLKQGKEIININNALQGACSEGPYAITP